MPPTFFYTLSREKTVPPIQRCAAGGDFTPSEGVHNGRLRRPGMPPPGGGGKRGRDTKVSLPLLTPRPFLRTRLPSVARLKARGPQGRLVLQGTTLDGSGAFRSGTLPPCTEWPRTVMRGKSRKVNSGHNSCPISKTTHGTELPYPRLAEHLRCDGSKEGQGESRGDRKPCLVSCPLLPSAVGTASPPPYRRKSIPSADGKEKKDLC